MAPARQTPLSGIGICLKVAEVRDIMRTAGFDVDPLDDYRIHSTAVQYAGDAKSPFAIGLQIYPGSTYANDVRRIAKVRDAEILRRVWQESFVSGDIGGALWAVITHPACR